MTKTKRQFGFSSELVLITILLIGVFGFTGWYFWHSKINGDNVKAPVVNNGIAVFSGVVNSDECAQQLSGGEPGSPPVGDVGCNITVNGQLVSIVHGNAYFPTWGRIEGFNASQNVTGKSVMVKAHKSGTEYSISGSGDYVKLLN